jgi:hypothetical protein
VGLQKTAESSGIRAIKAVKLARHKLDHIVRVPWRHEIPKFRRRVDGYGSEVVIQRGSVVGVAGFQNHSINRSVMGEVITAERHHADCPGSIVHLLHGIQRDSAPYATVIVELTEPTGQSGARQRVV